MTNSCTAVTNALVIGAINAEDANVCPRWKWKNAAAPFGYCKRGWYTLRYIRSIDSISNVTCRSRTSATLRGNVITGSGRGHRPPRPPTASGGSLTRPASVIVIDPRPESATDQHKRATRLVGLGRSPAGGVSLNWPGVLVACGDGGCGVADDV